MARLTLSQDKVAPAVQEHVANFHRDIVEHVASTVARDKVVVVGMAQNPFVKRARKLLDAEGVKFTYIEYGSYFGMWKQRLSIKLWSGWPTFPQVFVRGVLIGGFDDTRKVLEDGSLKKLLGS